MHPFKAVLAVLATAPLTWADFTQVDAIWSDNFNFVSNPLSDNSDTILEPGDVIQIGYFSGVLASKDPSTYTAADWATFTPLTGDGSANPLFFPTSINADFPGYFVEAIPLNTEVHAGVPTTDVRIGIRFFDATTAAGASNINTVSADEDSWIMKAPASGIDIPFPANADMDLAHSNGTLVWEGSPFKTDLVPGETAPSLVLTNVAQSSPTTLEISWSGGDGSNNIETSTDGTTWNAGPTGVSSPATLTIDPANVGALLVRVVEP